MAFRRPTDSNRVSLGLSDSSTRGFDFFPIRSNSTNPAAAYRSSVEMALQHHDLQNIAVALSAILRGVPWTVDHDLTIADELVIGVGTVELGLLPRPQPAALRRHHHRLSRRRQLPSRPRR